MSRKVQIVLTTVFIALLAFLPGGLNACLFGDGRIQELVQQRTALVGIAILPVER